MNSARVIQIAFPIHGKDRKTFGRGKYPGQIQRTWAKIKMNFVNLNGTKALSAGFDGPRV